MQLIGTALDRIPATIAQKRHCSKETAMPKIVQTAGRTKLSAFAPDFAAINDDILFGKI